MEENFLSESQETDLYVITNWHKYQDNISNYQHNIQKDETKEESRRRLKRESIAFKREYGMSKTEYLKQRGEEPSKRTVEQNVEPCRTDVENNVEQTFYKSSTNGGNIRGRNIENQKSRNIEISKKTKAKKEADFSDVEIPNFIETTIWQDWIRYRKEKQKPLTQTAVKQQISDFEKWHTKGHDPNEIIKTSIRNGWQGLFDPKEQHRATKSNFLTVYDGNNQTTKPFYRLTAEEAHRIDLENMRRHKTTNQGL